MMLPLLGLMLLAADPVTVTVFPRLGLAPLEVRIRVQVDRTPEFYCPSVKIEWMEGWSSFTEGDCDPWEEMDQKERESPWVWSKPSPGAYPEGEWVIRLILKQGKKEYHRDVKVEAH